MDFKNTILIMTSNLGAHYLLEGIDAGGSITPEAEAAVMNELFSLYEGLSEKTYMEDYRRWSNVLGRRVRFSSGDGWAYGTAAEIDDDGGLLIRMDDGEEQVLRTGEISLRVCDGK